MAIKTESTVLVYLESIKIYQWIFCIFGSTLPPPLYQPNTNSYIHICLYILSASYYMLLILLVMYTSCQHNMKIYESSIQHSLDCITSLMSYCQNHLLYVIIIVMVMQAFWNRPALKEIFHMINQMELEMSGQCVTIYRKSAWKWKLFRTSGLCFICVTTIIIYVKKYILATTLKPHVRVIIPFFIIAIQVKCIEYCVYIQIAGEFLEFLAKSLRCLAEDGMVQFQSQSSFVLQQLLRNQMFLNRLWIFVNKLEKYFVCPILLIFLYIINTVLSTINWTYVCYIYEIRQKNQFCRFSYIVIMLLPLLTLCSLAQNCIQKYQSLGSLLHRIKVKPQDIGAHMRLREYSLQLKHQSLEFTCNGYMDINYQTFGKLLLILCSYVVILIQFKLEDISMGAKIATQYIFGRKGKDK